MEEDMGEETGAGDDVKKSLEGIQEGKEGDEVQEVEGEHTEGEHLEDEQMESEHMAGEHVESEQVEGEHVEGEHIVGEHVEGEHVEGEQLDGEQMEGEFAGEGEIPEDAEDNKEEPPPQEEVEEEEGYVEEPPPDPAAPYDLSDSKEALKPIFELRPDQLAEVEQLWELYQNYTPVYTDIDGYITEKELVYMLKSLLLLPYTPEQLQELIAFCVRPPHPKGHITYEQFLKIVKMRQRDFPVEDELRSALQVFDPGKTGLVDRDNLKEVLAKQGHKMPQKQLDNLIKEVDMSNDGTIGIEDVVGTMCIDLNRDDIIMLLASLNPNPPEEQQEEF